MGIIMGIYVIFVLLLFIYYPYSIVKMAIASKEDVYPAAVVVLALTASLFGLDLIGDVLSGVFEAIKEGD